MDYTKIFTDNLKDIMNQRGYSQAWLADKTETTEATISRYFTGVHMPKIEMVAKMAKALGVSVDYLIGLSSSPIPDEPPTPEIRAIISAYSRAPYYNKQMVCFALDPFLTNDEREVLPVPGAAIIDKKGTVQFKDQKIAELKSE